MKLITKLTCSLVGQERNVTLVPGTRVHKIYGRTKTPEVFACNYGVNPDFEEQIQTGDLRVSGFDADGTIRAVELPDHPFFIATLFVPQIVSKHGEPHPLIAAFIESANTPSDR